MTKSRPPALNLTFDPGTWTLTWLCSDDVTVTSCSANQTLHGRLRKQKMKNPSGCRCKFNPLTLHLGVTLKVTATVAEGNVTISERLDYEVPGPLGSEAVNISCEIHDAAAMTGRQLPGCPGGPAPAGCSLHNLTGLPRQLHVTVAGSSRFGAIRPYDLILNTKAIERLSPPLNITGRCNASHCAVSWAPPRTWADMGFNDFRYELDLRHADTNPDAMVTISSRPENRYEFPSPEPRVGHRVRIRVGDVRSQRWSAWSPPVWFGDVRPAIPRLPIYVIAAAATLICALGLALAWKRFLGRRRLLPRIPEIPDKVSDNALVNSEMLRKDLAG
ncbi:hypothetical protein U0070_003057 [Myodes glareolus]|uniref:Fibronectin type-III domain-containing protein n=1 Tax=Myodes glareolus TaxID=447135 RepID=A0AAW0H0K4_MYOGA